MTDAAKAAAVGTSYSILVQVLSRVITFALNAVALRFVSKEILGLVNVRLQLLYTTTLFLAREPFRKACIRIVHGNAQWRQVQNLLWASPLAGAALASLAAWAWLRIDDGASAVAGATQYAAAVAMFATGAVVELLSEPLYIYAKAHLFVRLIAAVEAAAAVSRGLYVILVLAPGGGGAHTPDPLMAFSRAQLLYSCVVCVAYYAYFAVRFGGGATTGAPALRDLFPRHPRGTNEPWVEPGRVRMVTSFVKQGVLKQMLTEGERYVMTFFAAVPLAEQGVYDVVQNLGSLVARFLFKPVEENYYVLFNKTFPRSMEGDGGEEDDEGGANNDPPGEAAAARRQRAAGFGALCALVKLMALVGATFASFGPNYAALLLELYGGRVLSDGPGPGLLRMYSVYVLPMAVNGITECFFFAVAPRAYLDYYNRVQVGITAAFLAVAWVATQQFGCAGFIVANGVNMLLRVAHHARFIRRFARARGMLHTLRTALPSTPVLITFAVAFAVTRFTEQRMYRPRWSSNLELTPWLTGCAMHVGAGVAMLSMVGAALVSTERRFLGHLNALRKGDTMALLSSGTEDGNDGRCDAGVSNKKDD